MVNSIVLALREGGLEDVTIYFLHSGNHTHWQSSIILPLGSFNKDIPRYPWYYQPNTVSDLQTTPDPPNYQHHFPFHLSCLLFLLHTYPSIPLLTLHTLFPCPLVTLEPFNTPPFHRVKASYSTRVWNIPWLLFLIHLPFFKFYINPFNTAHILHPCVSQSTHEGASPVSRLILAYVCIIFLYFTCQNLNVINYFFVCTILFCISWNIKGHDNVKFIVMAWNLL